MLLRGPSGVGKSDLALQALQCGWRMVADDRTLVWRSGDRLYGRAPDTLHGLIEARGQGVWRLAAREVAPVALAVDLIGEDTPAERTPGRMEVEVCGVVLPRMSLRAREASTLARLALALQASVSPAATPPL